MRSRKNAAFIGCFIKFLLFLCLFLTASALLMLLSARLSYYPCGIADGSYFSPFTAVSATIFPEKKPLYILIDAGHGGEDGGAVSDGGLVEKDVNLRIAKKLETMLFLSDYPVVMLRQDDRLLYEPGQEKRKKYYDITNRIAAAQAYENGVLVSIHQNKFPIKKYSGLQVYYSKHHPHSEQLAKRIQENVRQYLQPDNHRDVKSADHTIRLLDSLSIPAVLAECGFLSNDAEAALLADDAYQNKIAYLLYLSILQYAASA